MGMGVASSSRRRGTKRTRRAAMAEINVTPLVDVMLVLLIIFMVTVTLPAVGVPVELPESRAAAVEEQPDQITISIDRAGVIYIENEAVAAGRLPEALEALDRGSQQPLIVLRGDRSLDYGRVMAVMGELGRSGFTSISLVTDGSVTPP
ncbi:ExbD/TolR family protein [Erythrobacter sanguineus]|uniref:Cell division and transport-associated protein TolR n=1 Tax=Erythrobacter sanguineus TaxID=198312 RepID=A0A1M7SBS9_9SPHN|nr:biopolymer transporter ExbD [Erythrobacter sanguineus]SHN55908.1 Cell division and transport-associated protein TolR [Erythrobacter sanguineus]